MIKNITVVALLVFLSLGQVAFGQSPFVMKSNFSRYFGALDFSLSNPPEAIGIGDFTTEPASALHINTNSYTLTYFNAGEVFRTNAPTRAGL